MITVFALLMVFAGQTTLTDEAFLAAMQTGFEKSYGSDATAQILDHSVADFVLQGEKGETAKLAWFGWVDAKGIINLAINANGSALNEDRFWKRAGQSPEAEAKDERIYWSLWNTTKTFVDSVTPDGNIQRQDWLSVDPSAKMVWVKLGAAGEKPSEKFAQLMGELKNINFMAAESE